jgi:hypothetical protein
MIGNWNTEAATMADYVSDNMFGAHRGAMTWRQAGVSVVFGNDGYMQGERARSEVAMVRQQLGLEGIPILGFGVDSEGGYSWAMLVKTGDIGMLTHLVWSCWMPKGPAREAMARPGRWTGLRVDIASAAIQESSPVPRVELD